MRERGANMKKILGFLLTVLIGLGFTMSTAKAVTYKTLNLEEALKEEEIEHDLSSYKESDDQAIIYLFRGNGCGYCRRFLTFLNSIVPEYGKYFKVVSYEVWGDSENKKLMNKVAEFLEKDAGGVPFIVIGDQAFEGYASDYDEDIKKAIKDLYNSKDKYDVLKEMEKAQNQTNQESNGTSSTSVIIWNIVFTCLATAAVIGYNTIRFNKIEKMMISKERKTK